MELVKKTRRFLLGYRDSPPAAIYHQNNKREDDGNDPFPFTASRWYRHGAVNQRHDSFIAAGPVWCNNIYFTATEIASANGWLSSAGFLDVPTLTWNAP